MDEACTLSTCLGGGWEILKLRGLREVKSNGGALQILEFHGQILSRPAYSREETYGLAGKASFKPSESIWGNLIHKENLKEPEG